MAIQTGNDCTERPVLRVTSNTSFAAADAILYITDLAVNGNNNMANYTVVDQCGTFKFPTTTDRSINVTFLRDDTVYDEIDGYFNDKTQINWELSPLGVASGQPYKTGSAYISTMNENKNGTNVWEIQIVLEVNGDVTSGTHA